LLLFLFLFKLARKAKQYEQLPNKDGLSDWIFTIFGYAIIALFASFPVTLILKSFMQVVW